MSASTPKRPTAINPAEVRISRERYMAARELLKNPYAPSQPVTYTELVSALYGKRDAPPWINDNCFEKELEELMSMDLVCVCRRCDSLMGFFRWNDTSNIEDLCLELLTVF